MISIESDRSTSTQTLVYKKISCNPPSRARDIELWPATTFPILLNVHYRVSSSSLRVPHVQYRVSGATLFARAARSMCHTARNGPRCARHFHRRPPPARGVASRSDGWPRSAHPSVVRTHFSGVRPPGAYSFYRMVRDRLLRTRRRSQRLEASRSAQQRPPPPHGESGTFSLAGFRHFASLKKKSLFLGRCTTGWFPALRYGFKFTSKIPSRKKKEEAQKG